MEKVSTWSTGGWRFPLVYVTSYVDVGLTKADRCRSDFCTRDWSMCLYGFGAASRWVAEDNGVVRLKLFIQGTRMRLPYVLFCNLSS